jgi:hypothetical protein
MPTEIATVRDDPTLEGLRRELSEASQRDLGIEGQEPHL